MVPTTVISPSILFDELEVKRTDQKNAKLPEYPPPALTSHRGANRGGPAVRGLQSLNLSLRKLIAQAYACRDRQTELRNRGRRGGVSLVEQILGGVKSSTPAPTARDAIASSTKKLPSGN